MSFCNFSKESTTVGRTTIENVFITNYLPDSPSDAVKVYLYGLYLCANQEEFQIEDMAQSLNISKEEIIDYFKYWEDDGIVRIISTNPFSVIYLPLNENTIKYKKYNPEKYEDFTKALQSVISERMLSLNELRDYFNLLESTPLKPEALLMIAKYCVDVKGANITYKYITTVAKDFINRGITTADLVERELSNYFVSTKEVYEILRALKSTKKADFEEFQLYKKWTENYYFEQYYILEVAKLSKIKSFKKLDFFIDELYSNKCFTISDAKDYIKNKEKLYSLSAEINRALGIYIEVLDTVVKNYVSPWTALGFNKEALLFIANYSFKNNKRTLEQMNESVNKLYNLGLITTESIQEYLTKTIKDNKFISIILNFAGISRRPNEWDRKNLETWRSWNFSDEVILEAVKKSNGITNPIPYINGILSNWKSKNAYTLEQINSLPKQQPAQNSNVLIDDKVKKQTQKIVEEVNLKSSLYSNKNYLDIINKIGELEYQIALSNYNDDTLNVANLEKELSLLNLEKEKIEKSILK